MIFILHNVVTVVVTALHRHTTRYQQDTRFYSGRQIFFFFFANASFEKLPIFKVLVQFRDHAIYFR